MEKWTRAKYQPNLPLGQCGEKVTAGQAHLNLSKEAAKEGMVLLKNNEILPLKKGATVALFGKGTFDYVKGGGGSGDVTVAYIRNIYEGFKQLSENVQVYEGLTDYYRNDIQAQYKAGAVPGMTREPELPDELLAGAVAHADVAVISICRFSGEGWDRKSVVDPNDPNLFEQEKEFAELSNKLFEEGDFYLTNAEKAMIAKVKTAFDQVVVVMNVGGMVDSTWFATDEAIGAVLMAWQGGIEGGLAAAELLCGISSPSGKLSDTYAASLEDYPSTYNFHESKEYVDYTDDIYVGYRYFETIPQAADKVNYPFGYGLTYTDFELEIVEVEIETEEVGIQVAVTNMGQYAAKEVVQVYVTPPQGKLGKALKNLVAFKKTRLLQPGETQRVVLSIKPYDFASYDDLGKIQKSAYVLEAGAYEFFVGNSVREGIYLDEVYAVKEDQVVLQLTSKIAPTSLNKRLLADGSYEELPMSMANDPNENVLVNMTQEETLGYTPADRGRDSYQLWKSPYKKGARIFKEVADGKMSLEDFMVQLSDYELACLLGGQPNTGVANTFGFGNLPQVGVPNIMTADGPAGLRVMPQVGVNTTCWPCSTLLACSWDVETARKVGEAAAKEVKENNIGVWLAPAINIHRSPLCGRNFEYYSEDPYLAGKMAGSLVQGVQSQKVAVSVKHFALNNKETNRKNSDSRVSERAAREIYLKAFERIVREADPWTIMSSYNIINGHRASENKELLEDILRDEWGFKGMVTSDWWTDGEHYKEVLAGNDVKMALGYPERLLEAMDKGVLSRADMEKSAKRVLELLLKID